jgi:hypothetical protein
MATVQKVIRGGVSLGLAALVSLAAGCVLPVRDGGPVSAAKVVEGGPMELAAKWQNEVRMTPDPTRGGAQTPVLAGRVYLFDMKGLPMTANGTLHFELADPSQSPPKVLEQWSIDKVTVAKMERRDTIGLGYSVILPWATFRPDLTRVHLRACYKPENGPPVYTSPSDLALMMPGPQPTMWGGSQTVQTPPPLQAPQPGMLPPPSGMLPPRPFGSQ